jgi:DNA-binding CsgD family transcriptional regulator
MQASNQVTIGVEDDHDAERIAAVLEALGYSVIRDEEHRAPEVRLVGTVRRLARRVCLTARETDVLEGVVAGKSLDQIASALEISRATVKWHLHNVFGKTKTNNITDLLRAALRVAHGTTEPT